MQQMNKLMLTLDFFIIYEWFFGEKRWFCTISIPITTIIKLTALTSPRSIVWHVNSHAHVIHTEHKNKCDFLTGHACLRTYHGLSGDWWVSPKSYFGKWTCTTACICTGATDLFLATAEALRGKTGGRIHQITEDIIKLKQIHRSKISLEIRNLVIGGSIRIWPK